MKNKSIVSLSIFLLAFALFTVPVFAQSVVYDSFIDEPESSGVGNANTIAFGDSAGDLIYESSILVLTIPQDAIADTLEYNVTQISGTPQTENFIYDGYICEASVQNLTANGTVGADCIAETETLVLNNGNISNMLSGLGLNNITLDQNFTFESSKDYIVYFDYISGGSNDSSTDRWQFRLTDGVSVISDFFRRNLDGTPTLLQGIAQAKFYGEPISYKSANAVGTTAPDCTFASTSFVTCFIEQFNTSKSNLNLTVLATFNLESSTGASNEITGRILIDDVVVHTENLRTVSGVGVIGSTGFSPFISNVTLGEHNFTLQFAGSLPIPATASNIDLILLRFDTATEFTDMRGNITTGTFTHSSTSFIEAFNWTIAKAVVSDTFILAKQSINSSVTTMVDYAFRDLSDNDDSPFWARLQTSSSQIGSAGGNFVEMQEQSAHNHSIIARTEAGTTEVNISILDMDLGVTAQQNMIENFAVTNPNTNLTNTVSYGAGISNVVNATVTARNGTGYLIAVTTSFNSSSGTQTPTYFINSTNTSATCSATKDRSLTTPTDAGNIFIYTICNNLTVGQEYEFNLWVDVPVGETVVQLDESMSGFEVTPFNIESLTFEQDKDADGWNVSVDCDDLNATNRPLEEFVINSISSDITVCTGTYQVNLGGAYLILQASGITIDFNGSTIDSFGNGIGITTNTRDNIIITNGIMTDFVTAIDINGGSNNVTMSNLTISSNVDGIQFVSTGTGHLIIDNLITGNTDDGISIALSSSSSIINNTITLNTDQGIIISGSSNTISGNTIANNTGNGISISSGSSNLIFNNFISTNTAGNVQDDGTSNNWNSSLTPAINIIGGANQGGNFYSDYTGQDTSDNGIGNTPFTISGTSGAIDFLPLTNDQPTTLITGLTRDLILIIPVLIGLLLIILLALRLAQENSIDMIELFMLMIVGVIILVVIWGLIQGLIFPTS